MRLRTVFASTLAATLAFATDNGLWKYLPPDATAISGIDVERTKNSPFGRYLLSQIADDEPALNNLRKATGFDPRRDLQSLIVAALPDHNSAVFLAHGVFDQAKILSTARSESASIIVFEGANVIVPKDETHWIAFLDSTLVLAGPAERIRAAIARAKSSVAPAGRLVKAQSLAATYDAWVVSSDPAGGLLKGIPANQNGDMLRSIRQAAGGVKFGVHIEIDAHATARSARDATALHDAIRFIAGMIRLNSSDPQSQPVTTLLDSMRLVASGDQVSLHLQLPESEIEKWIDSRRARRIATTY